MEKQHFHEHCRYTVTLTDTNGKLRPANIYVFKLNESDMIIRETDKSGLLRKVAYDQITKIVKEKAVPEQDRYYIPDAVLDESTWQSRSEMFRYSSSPHMGK